MIQIVGQSVDWRRKSYQMIQEQPATCVGLAFAIGLLAGWWVKR